MTRAVRNPRPARPRRPTRGRNASRSRAWLFAIPLIALGIVAAGLGVRLLEQPAPTSPATSAASPATGTGGAQAARGPTVGAVAPDGTFVTASGEQMSIASLRGRPTLVWFVSTWCSSCQAGTQAMASEISTFQRAGVRVVELELYNDLGQSGPDIGSFARAYGGSAIANPDWTFGQASQSLSQTYDAQSYLDIYYLLDAQGRIVYINGSPGESMPQLLSEVRHLK